MKKNIMKKKKRPTPEWLITVLSTGKRPQAGEDGCFERFTLNIDREWALHKKEIMPGWITEFPGKRPFAWWEFDAPEARKRISGYAIENEHTEGLPIWYGIPGNDTFFDLGIDEERIKESDFETQAAYLERHALLTKSEKKLLKINI